MTITKVFCHLKDCVYFKQPESLGERQRGICDCTHPEKTDYLDNPICPLYKKNWNHGVNTAALADRFSKKRKFG